MIPNYNSAQEETSSAEISLAERYKLMIAARNFHYDNFSKWMTYFYVAIGAVFIGYYSIDYQKHKFAETFSVLLPVVGYIVSLLWYWSCKGYYFWNINFITLVNHYEEDLLKLRPQERVYFVFANKENQNNYFNPISGANISTSKIAILFSFIITIVWAVLLIFEIPRLFDFRISGFVDILGAITLSIIITILISGILPKYFLYSNIDHMPDLHINPLKLKDNSENQRSI